MRDWIEHKSKPIILENDLLEYYLVEIKSFKVKEYKNKKDSKFPSFKTFEIIQEQDVTGNCRVYVTINIYLAGGVRLNKVNGLYQEIEIKRFSNFKNLTKN